MADTAKAAARAVAKEARGGEAKAGDLGRNPRVARAVQARAVPARAVQAMARERAMGRGRALKLARASTSCVRMPPARASATLLGRMAVMVAVAVAAAATAAAKGRFSSIGAIQLELGRGTRKTRSAVCRFDLN